MERASFQRTYLDYRANQIERTLFRMNLPVRVDGGSVHPGWVRYHLIPAVGIDPASLVEAIDELTDEMRLKEVRFAPEKIGVSLDISAEVPDGLRLLALFDSLRCTKPMVATCGMSLSGEPVLVDFSRPNTWHAMIISPPDSGASELIRTLILSLALNTSPDELQILGADIGGQELGILEALPHNHWDLATDVSSTVFGIEWLCRMVEFRQDTGQVTPHIILVVDDLTAVLDRAPELASNLHSIFKDGSEAGVHLITAAQWPLTAHQKWLENVEGVKAMLPMERSGSDRLSPGRFLLKARGDSIEIDAAWLPVQDLQLVAARVQERWVGED